MQRSASRPGYAWLTTSRRWWPARKPRPGSNQTRRCFTCSHASSALTQENGTRPRSPGQHALGQHWLGGELDFEIPGRPAPVRILGPPAQHVRLPVDQPHAPAASELQEFHYPRGELLERVGGTAQREPITAGARVVDFLVETWGGIVPWSKSRPAAMALLPCEMFTK